MYRFLHKSILSIFLLSIFSLSGCTQGPTTPQEACPGGDCNTPVNLTIWRLFEDRDSLEPLMDQYSNLYPNVTFSYKKMNYDDYEDNLINAISNNKGPDIFQIHNDWLPKHQEKIASLPNEIMTLDQYKERFVDVASDDFVANDQVYAIPLYVDTLALYYNPKIFEEKYIFSPPTTWEQVVNYSNQFTNTTPKGNITRSGITMGTANNINRASDILYALMLQNSTNMVAPDLASATFSLPIKTPAGTDFYPGENSLSFYTSFADPTHSNFCWDKTMMGSIDAFEKGQAAMTINYSYYKTSIEKFKDPNVKVEIAKLPQINTTDDPISYANYWGETVNKQSRNVAWAWDFLKFVTSNESYNSRTGRPTSLRAKSKDSDKVFDKQAYYARSFYKIRAKEIDDIFNQMIDSVAINNIPVTDALKKAQNDITALMIRYRKEG